MAPAAISAGTVFQYSGTFKDSVEGTFTESRSLVVTSGTHFEGGTYTYSKTGANTATVAYHLSETGYSENGTLKFTYSIATAGTFTLTASYNDGGTSGTLTGNGSFTFSGNEVVLPPVLTSAGTASILSGQSFAYTAAFSGSPTSYSVSGLPAGLSLNTSTGVISGRPSAAGTYQIALGATNGGGTGTGPFILTVVPPGPPPSVTALTPASGGTSGGTGVTITGTGFTGATSVTFGGAAATSVSVVNATTITATTPARTPGTASVVVTTLNGSNAANTLFTYLPSPTVTSNTAALFANASTISITGTGFSTTPGNNTVAFTHAGTGIVTASSATSLTITSLSGLTLGALNAVVTTNGISSGAAVQVANIIAPPPPGSVDAAFNTAVSNGGAGFVSATAVLPDGKMIIGGYFIMVGGQAHANIARLNADGSVDASFTASTDSAVRSVVVQADGKLVIGGAFNSVNGSALSMTTGVNRIARLNADGTLDTAFNTNGGTGLGGADGDVFCVALQSDGKLVLGGRFTSVNRRYTTAGGLPRSCIARLNADGTLDATFNPSVTGSGGVYCVAIQANGKLVLGGDFISVNGSAVSTTTGVNNIARLNEDGTQDTAFNASSGTGLGGVNDTVISVAVQADGKLVLAGSFTSVNGSAVSTTTGVNRITRLNADGTRDTAFNTSGGTGLGGANGRVRSVALQADGKLVLGGEFTSVNGSTVNAMTGVNYIARLNADGTRDTAFNTSGGIGLGGVNGIVYSVAVQSDGKLVLGGAFTSVNGSGQSSATGVNRIVRLNADGTRDTAFNTSGGTGLGGVDSAIYSVAVQADGKLVLGGLFTRVNNSAVSTTTGVNRIARLNADGTRDTAFNTSGGTGLGGVNGTVTSVAVQSDGKLVLGGSFTSVNGTARSALARLNNDAATQSLTAPNTAQVLWSRSGAGPELSAVTFEQSTDGGTNWSPVGSGTRVGSTANWQLTGLSLPSTFSVRARGRTTGGFNSGSSGLIEQVAAFTFSPPAPTVTLNTVHLDNTANSLTITGANFSTTPGNNTVVFTPTGTGTVTASTATSLTVTGLSGLTSGSLNAVVTTSGQSSGAAVQVAIVTAPPAGSLDTLFNAAVTGDSGYVYTTAVLPDGKMIVGGKFTTAGGTAHANIARLNADGSVDASFTASTNDTVWTVAVQADGKLVIGGNFTSVNGSGVSTTTGVNGIARLNADGTRDTGFNTSGGTGLGGVNYAVTSVVVQADGKLVLGGYFTRVNGSTESPTTGVNNIARLNADGTRDTVFNASGGIGLGGVNGGVDSVAVQADGRLVLGGNFTSVNGSSVSPTTGVNYIARLNADGTRDTAFNLKARMRKLLCGLEGR